MDVILQRWNPRIHQVQVKQFAGRKESRLLRSGARKVDGFQSAEKMTKG
jgi:hypothetical protein